MKKVFAITLAAVLLCLTLCACGGDQQQADNHEELKALLTEISEKLDSIDAPTAVPTKPLDGLYTYTKTIGSGSLQTTKLCHIEFSPDGTCLYLDPGSRQTCYTGTYETTETGWRIIWEGPTKNYYDVTAEGDDLSVTGYCPDTLAVETRLFVKQ